MLKFTRPHLIYRKNKVGDNVLSDLIRAKENIKRKYLALNHGEADIQSYVENTLEQVI